MQGGVVALPRVSNAHFRTSASGREGAESPRGGKERDLLER